MDALKRRMCVLHLMLVPLDDESQQTRAKTVKRARRVRRGDYYKSMQRETVKVLQSRAKS